MAECLYRDDNSELWHADCLDSEQVAMVMGQRRADAVITDAPYSDKTHQGHKNGKLTADRAAAFAAAHSVGPTPESRYSARKSEAGESGRRDIDYPSWSAVEIEKFCDVWSLHNSGWYVSITDDVLAPNWSRAFESRGLYRFSPLALVETGSRVRMTGDGPSNWSCWIVVARPKSAMYSKWGALPGAYVQPAERLINSTNGTDRIVGGKPLKSMMAIVSDYSRPGDLVVDPCAGACTTGLAALRAGRRFIGLEKNREHAELSAEILRAESHQSNRRQISAGQEPLFR